MADDADELEEEALLSDPDEELVPELDELDEALESDPGEPPEELDLADLDEEPLSLLSASLVDPNDPPERLSVL